MHKSNIKEYKIFEQEFNRIILEIASGSFTTNKLDLSGAPLSRLHIQQLYLALHKNLESAAKIRSINLSGTKISNLPLDIFKECDSLHTLILDNNKLNVLPNLPDRPSALQYFSASNNPLKSLPRNYFNNCNSLVSLHLNETNLHTPPNLTDSLGLKILHLANTKINSFTVNYFNNMTYLMHLYLYGTHIKKLPILLNCKQLKEIWLESNINLEQFECPYLAKVFYKTNENKLDKLSQTKYYLSPIANKLKELIKNKINKNNIKELAKSNELNLEFSANVEILLIQLISAVKLLQDFNLATNIINTNKSSKTLCNISKHTITRLFITIKILEKFINKNKKRSRYFVYEFNKQVYTAESIINLGYKMIELLKDKINNNSTNLVLLPSYHRKDSNIVAKIEFQLLQNYLSLAKRQASANFFINAR